MRAVTIINQKGGCGKTTTAISLAGVFARSGLRTLLIDMDPQSHCAAGLAIPEQQFDLDISDALLADDLKQIDPARLVWRISRNLDLAPSRMRLAGLEASRGGLADKPDRERRLARVVEWLSSAYDVCCIDCSPSIGLLTYNALIAADECLIPVETSYFSLQGAQRQVQTIEALQKRLGAATPVWLLATIHDASSSLAADLLQELRRLFGQRVAPQVIRQDMRVKEAASFGKPVCDYAPESPSALDYTALAEWLLSREPASPAASPTASPTASLTSAPTPATAAAEPFGGETRSDAEPLDADPDLPELLVTGRGGGTGAFPEHASSQRLNRAGDVAAVAARLATRPPAAEAAGAGALLSGPPGAQHGPASFTELKPAPESARPAAASTLEAASDIVTEAERIVAANPGASGFGAHSVPGGVVFVQPLSAGQQLAIATDVGGAPAEYPMRRNERAQIHELRLAIPSGSCAYRLVVDGRPTVDPFNRMVEMNPFGAPMSVAFAAAATAGSPQ